MERHGANGAAEASLLDRVPSITSVILHVGTHI